MRTQHRGDASAPPPKRSPQQGLHAAMLSAPLSRSTQYRLLVCLLLLTGLLLAGAGVFPASAQPSTRTVDDTIQRYGWVNGGIGTGRTGIARSVAGGVPVGDRLFVGGRYVGTKEFDISLAPTSSPSASNWDAGPLVGLVGQGRWGHLSLASGVAVVGGQRPDESESKSLTLGIPLNLQAFFTPIRYVGIGAQGYANVNADDNLLGVSLQVQVRIPQ